MAVSSGSMIQTRAQHQRPGAADVRIKVVPSEKVSTQRLLELRALVEKLKRVPSPPSGRRPAHKDKAVMTTDFEENGSLIVKNYRMRNREL